MKKTPTPPEPLDPPTSQLLNQLWFAGKKSGMYAREHAIIAEETRKVIMVCRDKELADHIIVLHNSKLTAQRNDNGRRQYPKRLGY